MSSSLVHYLRLCANVIAYNSLQLQFIKRGYQKYQYFDLRFKLVVSAHLRDFFLCIKTFKSQNLPPSLFQSNQGDLLILTSTLWHFAWALWEGLPSSLVPEFPIATSHDYLGVFCGEPTKPSSLGPPENVAPTDFEVPTSTAQQGLRCLMPDRAATNHIWCPECGQDHSCF